MVKWPGNVGGNAVFGRFRFCVPSQYEQQAKEIIGKNAPQELFGLTDSSISTGLTVVKGNNSSYNVGVGGDLMYFPAEQYEGKITPGMYYNTFRYIWASETGTNYPKYDRISDETDGLNLGMYSIGLKHGNLDTYLKHYYNEQGANPAFVDKWKALEKVGLRGNESKIKQLWMETYRGDREAMCRAQWTEFWDYCGKVACDAFVSGGYTSLFALTIIIEFANWKPGLIKAAVASSPANGPDEKQGLMGISKYIGDSPKAGRYGAW